jgi:ADP-ribosylation factor-like protein 2
MKTRFQYYVKELELSAIKTHHWSIYPVSAVTGQNLIDAMDWLVQDIASRIFVAN